MMRIKEFLLEYGDRQMERMRMKEFLLENDGHVQTNSFGI
jgi:hypothetical protein